MEKKEISYIQALKNKRLTTVAGAWVFYFLTALLPIVFLMLTAFAVFNVSLRQTLISRLPEEFRVVGETVLQTAENSSSGVTIFFVVAVIFSGSTLLNQMLKDGEYIYERGKKQKNGLIRRTLSVVAVMVLFLIFLGLATLSVFQSMLFKSLGINDTNVTTILFFTIVVVIGYFAIVLLNKFVSPERVKFSEIVWGSFLSLSVIVVGTIGFTLYLRFFKPYNAFYGGLAGIIVFLVWTYILMLGLVFGVSVNATNVERRKKREKRRVKENS